MKRFLAVALAAFALAGCATYDGYGYRSDGYYEDRYAERGYYYDRPMRYAGYYGGYPDYVYWSDYYSVLWPVYRGWYDPFYSPGFYYGVTWYPRTYFGLNHYWNAWPYYHAYAPYRHSYWDGYYDHWDRRRGRHAAYGSGGSYLYGSARNEAEQLARRTGAGIGQRGAQPGLQYDPFAAQRTSPLARSQLLRDPVRGQYPDRGVQPQAGDGGSRAALRGLQQREAGYGNGAIEPGRTRTFDRGNPPTGAGARESGWVGQYPSRERPSGERFQRATPNYRDIGGTPAPISRQPLQQMPERSTPRQREIQEYRSAVPLRQREAEAYQRSYPIERGDVRSERMEAMPRQQTPQREMYQRSEPRYAQPQRYEQPQRFEQPRHEAPSRSADMGRMDRSDMGRSQPQRSESFGGGSARDEARRSSRDER
jgi:hypothetical protein